MCRLRAVSGVTVDTETAFFEATRFIQRHGYTDKQQLSGAAETSGRWTRDRWGVGWRALKTGNQGSPDSNGDLLIPL